MARSKLTSPTDDLVTDSGAVLWSFVKGEQLELPVSLNFIENASLGYHYEAVVIEAFNVANQASPPTTVKPGGVQTVLNVRVPVYKGAWSAWQAYNREDIVLHEGLHYKLASGLSRVSAMAPTLDPVWETSTSNRVYLQFPSTLGSEWAVQPTVGSSTHGFFELRVTEPEGVVFRRTWKPVRGMVEILFSPTDIVADV
jgi:hypothetical protein